MEYTGDIFQFTHTPTMPKQPFTHKPNVPRNPKPMKREQHGEKVQPQRELAKRKTK